VSRKPQDLFLGEQHVTADLLDPEAVRRAVSGSEVVLQRSAAANNQVPRRYLLHSIH
jgi:hypothetical protein